MKLQKCEMCGKLVVQVSDHHVIPWWLSHDDSESNIMRLCSRCHGKADGNFISLILYGKMGISKSTRVRAARRYSERYIKRKQLYSFRLLKHTQYCDRVSYNIKTGVITIKQGWQYFPKKPGHAGSSIGARRRCRKAATAKCQTTLSGGGIK